MDVRSSPIDRMYYVVAVVLVLVFYIVPIIYFMCIGIKKSLTTYANFL